MKSEVQVVVGDGIVGIIVEFPAELVEFIAAGGDMAGKRAAFTMDREQALVVADDIRQAALAL